MKNVHRSCGYLPFSKGNMMEVDQGKGKSRGKKGRSSKGKGRRQGKSTGTGKEETSWTMSLVPGTSLWLVKGVNSFGKGHKNSSPFRQAYLEGDMHDWITGAVLLQSRFHLCRILPVLTSTKSSFSILEPQCPWEAENPRNVRAGRSSTHLTSRVTTSLFLREWTGGRVHECFCLHRTYPAKSFFTFEC